MADDDPFSQLSPAERAYLFGGGKQQQGGTTATPASTTGPTTPPATTTGAPSTGGLWDMPEPGSVRYALRTGIQSGLATVLNAPSDWARRAGFNVGNAVDYTPTPEDQASQEAHPVWSGIGRFAGEAVAGAPAVVAGEAALPAAGVLASPIVRGAIMGAGQNALTSAGSPDQPIAGQMATGAAFGAGGGWLGGRIGRMFGSDATLASPAVQDAGKTAQAAGIDVLPGNLPQAGATAAQKGAAATPGQMQQVNKAFGDLVGGKVGANVNDFSAKNLGPLTNQVGSEISTAVNQGQVTMTPQLESQLQTVLQNAHAPGIDPLVTAKIEHEVDKVLSIAPNMGDTVSGSQFDRLVGSGSKLSNYVGDNNKDLSDLAHQLDTTLDGAFQASSKPGVYGQYVDAKTRFRLLKAIEDNVEADPAGNIKPGTIMADIDRRFPNMPSQTGPGTVGQASDLARAVTTLFGGGQGAPGAAAGSGWLSRHPGLAMLGAGGVAGGAGDLYRAVTDPAAIGNALSWGASHIPTAGIGAAALGTELALRRLGAAYQQSGTFANALLQRGTQQASNPLAAYLGAAAAAVPPDRPKNR